MVQRYRFAAVAVVAALFSVACSLPLDDQSALSEATAPFTIEEMATSTLGVETLSDALNVIAQTMRKPSPLPLRLADPDGLRTGDR